MTALCKLNLLLCFRKRTFIWTTILFLFLAITHVYLLSHLGKLQGFRPDIWNFMVFSLGGVSFQTGTVLQYMIWVCSVAPLFLFMYHVHNVASGFDLFLILRSSSRAGWWSARIITLCIISILYSLWLTLCHFIIGILYFPLESGVPSYKILYSFLNSLNYSQYEVVGLMILLLTSGLLAISIFTQSITVFFKNASSAYVLMLCLSIILGQLYLRNMLPRMFSPIFFSSFVDVFTQTKWTLSFAIGYNVGLSTLSYLAGILAIRKFVNLDLI